MRPRLKIFVSLFACLALAGVTGAQPQPSLNPPTRSLSGQFLLRADNPHTDAKLISQLTASGDFVQLNPSLLSVSCERIKQLFWRKLAAKPSWQGRIYIELRTTYSAADDARLISEKFPDRWNYRMQLPDVIERERFVRVIVHALLLETANRGATDRSTELPLWLVEGLAHELLISGDTAGELKIILPPPSQKEAGLTISRLKLDERRTNSLYWAHVVLTSQPPLTFEELSWPADDELLTEASEVYQSSAQLFVDRLLEFRDGPAALLELLNDLPKHLNWQLAFLEAFKTHFHSMLDVEKWWAVQVSDFTGRDLEQTWSSAESWKKLDDAIRASVKINIGGGGQPLRTEVDMQTILRDSDSLEQVQFYRLKLDLFNALRLHVSQDQVALVDEYRQAITGFLNKQKITNPFLRIHKFHELMVNRAAKDLTRQLDALEVKREALRPVPKKPDATEQENISAAFR